MVRYTLLIKYTEIGISQIQNTPTRAADFKATAAAMGVSIDGMFWTLGEFDGVFLLSAPVEQSVIALATELARRGYVRTHLLRAFNEDEFAAVLKLMPSAGVDLDA